MRPRADGLTVRRLRWKRFKGLLCGYGMDAMEEAWAWWMRQPEYGRDCADPLDYFSGDALEDITTAAFADSAKARLAARARG